MDYGFQGRRLDPESGLLYFRHRYYDPVLGRFVQRDPVWDAGNVGGWYSFVGASPASRSDPRGLGSEPFQTLIEQMVNIWSQATTDLLAASKEKSSSDPFGENPYWDAFSDADKELQAWLRLQLLYEDPQTGPTVLWIVKRPVRHGVGEHAFVVLQTGGNLDIYSFANYDFVWRPTVITLTPGQPIVVKPTFQALSYDALGGESMSYTLGTLPATPGTTLAFDSQAFGNFAYGEPDDVFGYGVVVDQTSTKGILDEGLEAITQAAWPYHALPGPNSNSAADSMFYKATGRTAPFLLWGSSLFLLPTKHVTPIQGSGVLSVNEYGESILGYYYTKGSCDLGDYMYHPATGR